jgi:transposase-like protein
MTPPPTTQPNKRHRFPAEIISHCVWLSFRFSLSYRDVEELMLERGVLLSHEAVRYWCRKFGQAYARRCQLVEVDTVTRQEGDPSRTFLPPKQPSPCS